MIVISLPLPPSVNALYAGKGRRYKSKRYESWIIEARNALRMQKWTPYGEVPLSIHYRFGRPDKRVRDLLNLPKGIDDLLTSEGIIADDSWIHHAILEWANVQGAHIRINALQEAGSSL